jgi:hypothetical protein
VLLTVVPLLLAVVATEQLYIVDYEIEVTRVTRAPQADSYQPRLENIEISARPILRVEDELALFEWQFFDIGFDLRLTNRPKGSNAERLVVLSDRAEFVDDQGQSHGLTFRFTHGNPRKGKEIRPGKNSTYQLVPSDYLERRRTLFGPPIAGRVAKTPEELLELYEEQVGRTFQVRLRVQVGPRVYDYEFRMRVSRIVPRLMPKERF